MRFLSLDNSNNFWFQFQHSNFYNYYDIAYKLGNSESRKFLVCVTNKQQMINKYCFLADGL